MHSIHPHIDKDGFRLRGTAMSRIDGFSDVVFGFALTLLVVSLEVPRTYDELHNVMLGSYPFAICFALFISIWRSHFKFFRRYGLHDDATVWINSVLLFTAVIFVYPLKFLFTIATRHVESDVFTGLYQLRELMVFYGLGFAAVYLCFATLYANAWRQRHHLHLNPLELTLTKTTFWNAFGNAAVGILSAITACLLAPQHAGRAGYVYGLLFVYGRIHAVVSARYAHAARSRLTAEDRAPLLHSA